MKRIKYPKCEPCSKHAKGFVWFLDDFCTFNSKNMEPSKAWRRLSLGHQPIAPLLFQRHLRGAPFFFHWSIQRGETVELNWSGYHLRTFSGYHAKKTPGKMCYVDANNVASNIQQFKIPKCLPSDSPSITRKAEVQLTIWRKNWTNPQIPTFQSISQTSIL